MLRTNNQFGMDRVKTNLPRGASSGGSYSKIPAIQDLELPSPAERREGLADMRFDPKALVWVKKREIRPVEREVAPPVSVTPRNAGDQCWEFYSGSVRLWSLLAPSFDEARAEFSRLCAGNGYRFSDGRMRRGRSEPVVAGR
jgi:hypothetical protein